MNKDKRNNIKLLGTLNNADESGIIANANQIYDANENKSTQDVSKEHTERIKILETKENSMQTTLENITKTGEASAASNVTYNHSDSNLDATNVQQAIDEVSNISYFVKKGGIINVSTNYNSTNTAEILTLEQAIAKVPSSDRVLGFTMTFLSSDGWKNYQFIGTTINNWTDINNWTSFVNDAQLKSNQDSIIEKLNTKVNTSAIVQQIGDSTTSVMSQKAVTDAIQAEIDRATATEQAIIYDVSARNSGVVFESLSALLSSSNLSTLIPISVRHGGMSIRFIQGSVLNPDNKYVQYRLIAQNFTTNTTKWVIDDGGVYVESPMWIRVITDKEDRILAGIKPDGSVEWNVGIPTPVKEYVDGKLGNFATDDYDDIVTFLGNLIKSDETLQNLLDEKVISETGKSLIDEGYADSVEHVENTEYADVKIDANGRMLEAIKKDGSKKFFVNVSSEQNIQGALVYDKLENKTVIDYNDFAKAYLINDVLVYAVKRDGTLLIPKIENKVLDDRFFGRTIIASNKPSMMESLLLQSLYSLNKDGNGKFVRNTTLLQFSDVHGSLESLKNIQTFYNLYGKYITDIFHNGDIVQNAYDNSDYTFWNNVDISKNILNCIGNHDTCKAGTSDWQYYSGSAAYDRYFADYISHWGVNYTSGNCYYYKDYANGLRFIVLDENLKDYEDELSWLEGVLDDALTNNYHVVIATHSTQGSINVKAQFKNNISIFSRLDEYVGNMHDFRGASDLVESFVNKGGKFCCWLVGHAHCTDLGYNDLYPNRLIIAADIVSPTRFSKDIEKSEGNNTECSFNIVSFDTSATLIKIIKVGANYDKFYRNKNTLVYNYTSNEIISEN